MLKLDNITKVYEVGDLRVEALKGLSLEFRKNEFVSILGPSGCGKTTLLNIIGGLDRYTSGDLVINDKSTKDFKDKDWDTYRNHSIGFVFQSYNLIPHQTVLENVELALTLSGVSKEERKKKAISVLEKVGLKDKLKSKPNQLSGGQMQRVAIARALVNDPEIILADEPTGALDSATSVQIMELLKEISKDKLIIMVTHNPSLAETYSTRIVKLLDGELIDDSNPYKQEGKEKKLLSLANDEDLSKSEIKKKNKKKRMSFFTALALSFKNLLTKKGRTLLVSFAGSIGIIGIALILAISSGFSSYVDKMQKDTLSTYPLTLTSSQYDMASLMQIFLNKDTNDNNKSKDKVYTKEELTDMLSKFNSSSSKNDLKSFKEYIEGDAKEEIAKYTSAIQYDYNINVNAYYESDTNGLVSANLTTVFADIIESYPKENLTTKDEETRYGLLSMMFGSSSSYYSNEFWSEMLDNEELLKSQYELVGKGSKWAKAYNEIMIVVDENNQISDYTLYGLGLLDQDNLNNLLDNYIKGENSDPIGATFEYEELLGLKYKLLLESDYYEDPENDGTYFDIRNYKKTNPSLYAEKLQMLYDTKGIEIKVAGLIREKEEASALSISTCVGYKSSLTKHIMNANNNSDIVKAQLANPTKNVLTNQDFVATEKAPISLQMALVLSALGYADETNPNSIYLYPVNFEAKGEISRIIEEYNASCLAKKQEDKVITYSDTVGTMMSSISTIISAITYVLVAFVGVSLVVSSIMIGIITYISVIERTKEIGVLRSIGASKKDVSRVFTAESFIIGLSSGLFGIIISYLLTIPINIILASFTGMTGIASLPILSAGVLILISIALTLIAGFFPSRVAAKKDPVVALRSN